MRSTTLRNTADRAPAMAVVPSVVPGTLGLLLGVSWGEGLLWHRVGPP